MKLTSDSRAAGTVEEDYATAIQSLKEFWGGFTGESFWGHSADTGLRICNPRSRDKIHSGRFFGDAWCTSEIILTPQVQQQIKRFLQENSGDEGYNLEGITYNVTLVPHVSVRKYFPVLENYVMVVGEPLTLVDQRGDVVNDSGWIKIDPALGLYSDGERDISYSLLYRLRDAAAKKLGIPVSLIRMINGTFDIEEEAT